jgi:hypothetical protein
MRLMHLDELTRVAGGTEESIEGINQITATPHKTPQWLLDAIFEEMRNYNDGNYFGGSGDSGSGMLFNVQEFGFGIDFVLDASTLEYLENLFKSEAQRREELSANSPFGFDRAQATELWEAGKDGTFRGWEMPDGTRWSDTDRNGVPDLRWRTFIGVNGYPDKWADMDFNGTYETFIKFPRPKGQ